MGETADHRNGASFDIGGLLSGSFRVLHNALPPFRLIGREISVAFVAIIVRLHAVALSGMLAALAYYRLRSIKEGIDIDQIADVFD